MGGLLMRRAGVAVILVALIVGALASSAVAKATKPSMAACKAVAKANALSDTEALGRATLDVVRKYETQLPLLTAADVSPQSVLQHWLKSCRKKYPNARFAKGVPGTAPPTTTLAVGSRQLLLTALQWCASHEGSASVPGCLAEYSEQATADPGTPPNSALETALTYPFNASDLDASPAGVGTQGAAWCSDPANVDALRMAARTDPLPLAVLQQVATSLPSSVQELVCQRATLTLATTPTTTQPQVVTYEVTGDGSADLTITNASGGTEQKTVNLPYSEQLNPPPDGLLYLSAQLNGSGSISCKISFGGQVVQQASSQGDYVIASCSGSI
jgi:hypothetical protein